MEPRIRAAADITGLGVLRLIDGPDDSMFVEGWDPSERTWSRKSVDGRTVESIVLGALSTAKLTPSASLAVTSGCLAKRSRTQFQPITEESARTHCKILYPIDRSHGNCSTGKKLAE